MSDTVRAGDPKRASALRPRSVSLLIALAVFPGRSKPARRADDPGRDPRRRASCSCRSCAPFADRRELLNAENLVAFGFVFWLLLDLIQGAYDLRDAADWAIRDAFIAIGVSAAAMWLGVAGKPWPLPNWLGEIATRPMDTRTVGAAGAGLLRARHVQLRVRDRLRHPA